MEIALLARLKANAGLQALISDRVDWVQRPPGDALPGVTLQVINLGRGYTHDGADALCNSAVQIDCWGSSYQQAKQVAQATISALEPAAVQGSTSFAESFLSISRDFPPEDIGGGAKVHRVSQEWSIWWQPAY